MQGNDLVLEEGGENRPLDIVIGYNGLSVGCTFISWKAWDYIKSQVEKNRPVNCD